MIYLYCFANLVLGIMNYYYLVVCTNYYFKNKRNCRNNEFQLCYFTNKFMIVKTNDVLNLYRGKECLGEIVYFRRDKIKVYIKTQDYYRINLISGQYTILSEENQQVLDVESIIKEMYNVTLYSFFKWHFGEAMYPGEEESVYLLVIILYFFTEVLEPELLNRNISHLITALSFTIPSLIYIVICYLAKKDIKD